MVIYHTPMLNMNCQRWRENPNSPIALAPNMLLVLLGWCIDQMSFHAPRPSSSLALLSSFKLFLIARAIGGSRFELSSA
jgi:hypothetical protein